MQRPAIFIASIGAITSGCSGSGSDTSHEEPTYCAASTAKIAAARTIAPIFAGIAKPLTREASCEDLDDVLRGGSTSLELQKYKPADCAWGYREAEDPYDLALKIIEPRGDTLAKLCDWERKDAQRASKRLHDRGAAVLNSLPKSEREQIQREWDSYASDQ